MLALLLLTFLAYSPGLSGPYLLDDYPNIRPIGDNGGITSGEELRRFVFGNISGPLGRPVAMASFPLDAQDWPANPANFKYTNLLLHLLSGVLLFRLGQLLFGRLLPDSNRSSALALVLAALWLVHPLNVSTTLYIVQRMTQLMTLFTLAALLCYCSGRMVLPRARLQGYFLLCASLFPFGLLAVLSKENGALLLLLIVALEFTVFRNTESDALFKWWFRAAIYLPIALMFAYLAYTLPDSLLRYETRHFSLSEWLLTESRVLVSYLQRIFIPNVIGAGLFHDDLEVSTGLLRPLTTLPSVVGIFGLLALAMRWLKSQPVFSLAVLWFFATHLLESTVLPLELYFEHRNYLPMIGPLFALVWYGNLLVERIDVQESKRIMQAIVAVVLAIMTWSTWQAATIWGDANELFAYWAYEKPRSIRAQIQFADYLTLVGEPEQGLRTVVALREYYPDEITLMLHQWNMACDFRLQPEISFREIANREQLEYLRNDINSEFEILLGNFMGNRCDHPPLQDLIALSERIDQLHMTENNQIRFHFILADLYIFTGQLDQALINLTQSFRLSGNALIPIRQAMLSYSAGNLDDSLVFLQRAETADQARNPLLPSVQEQIDLIRRNIELRRQQGN